MALLALVCKGSGIVGSAGEGEGVALVLEAADWLLLQGEVELVDETGEKSGVFEGTGTVGGVKRTHVRQW